MIARPPLAISLGAIAGSLSRYYLTLGLNQWLGTAFPFSTFVINLTGAFGMGFFTTLTLDRLEIPSDIRLLVTVGFLGAYTTFSTYELDVDQLLVGSDWRITTLYWICTAVFGVFCLEIGSFLARKIP